MDVDANIVEGSLVVEEEYTGKTRNEGVHRQAFLRREGLSATAHQTVIRTVEAACDGFETLNIVCTFSKPVDGLVFLAGSFNRELNGISSSLGSQVIHPGLEALSPAIEMH